MYKDISFEQSNLVNKYEYDYRIKCKNNKNCNGFLPDRWFEVRGRYLCVHCERFIRNKKLE